MHIRQLISDIQAKPERYVKEMKIEYIHNILMGFSGASSEVSNDLMDFKFNLWFLKWLFIWIKDNVDPEYDAVTFVWSDYIKKIAQNEQDEVDTFFRLCELFFEDYDKKAGYFSWREE